MYFVKRIYHDFMRFVDRNPIYLACSVVYYLVMVWLFGWKGQGFFTFAIIYILSLFVAFSPLGEKLLRLFNHIRRLESAREKEYLRPLFQEVYKKAQRKNPELPEIDLYIIDSMIVNSCAIGKHTVAVTKGAMHTFSEAELKAVLAHEIAHILNMDTAALIYAMVGNGIFSAIILVFKMICWLISLLWNGRAKRGFIERMADRIVFVFMFLMTMAMAASDRKAEHRADVYTIKLGYGEDMVEALYLLEKINLSPDKTITEKLQASHPRITARLEYLEQRLGIQKVVE
ncbi:MAG: M48 family metalloprotease [Firmicutes bacterium]|nr:M48 family metalloprotease [Bacillota bacterium]